MKKSDADGKTALEGQPISNFRVSKEALEALGKRNITRMFPIQEATFDLIYDGKDVVGQAKTGTGKTLAFALPIVERLRLSDTKKTFGRMPRVLVLSPTRELAKQIAVEFESVAGKSFATLCVYGGTPYPPQEAAFRRGVDILVGTTGRIKDLLERGTFKLDNIQVAILDEADEMFDMGFAEHVEQIFAQIPAVAARMGGTKGAEGGQGDAQKKSPASIQTLLFSATMPHWVDAVTKKYLKPDKVKVDLVKSQKNKAPTLVKHIAIPCHWKETSSVVGELLLLHGNKARTIIFTDTKKEANELVMEPSIQANCQALHGDIPQAQREATLKGFKAGKFTCLVATDVAARGLDIQGVDLVIQCGPPKDHETYLHRAGRTGRAGKTGMVITLFSAKQLWHIQNIEKRAGVKFITQGPPQPEDLLKISADHASRSLDAVEPSLVASMITKAEHLIKEKGAVPALAAALVLISGHTKSLAPRSLLSAAKGSVTVEVKSQTEIHTMSFVWNAIRRYIYNDCDPDAKISGLRLTADGYGAVFDIPVEDKERIDNIYIPGGRLEIIIAKELPPLAQPLNLKPPERKYWGKGKRSNGESGESGTGGAGRASSRGGAKPGRGRGGASRGRGGGRGGTGRGTRGSW